MVTLDPPPDLVEIADALDAMAKPHVGSGWVNVNYTDLPCTTPRQKVLTVLVRKIAELENEKDGE